MKYLTTLTGPTCAGKSTLERMLADRGAQRAVSTTTRPPRSNEQDGHDYYFVTDAEFHALQANGGLVECAKFGDYWYGMTVGELERLYRLGDYVVYVCEPQGAKQVQVWANDRPDIALCQVWVDNPLDVIHNRFLARFTDEVRTAAMLRIGDPKAIVARFAKRLTQMQTTEQAWRNEAMLDGVYQLKLEAFDAYNEKAVAITLANPACLPHCAKLERPGVPTPAASGEDNRVGCSVTA